MNRIKGWWPEAVLLLALGLITLAAAVGWTAGLDEAVRDLMRRIQVEPVRWLAMGLNLLGQGVLSTWILGLGLSVLLFRRTRNWKVFLPWATAFAMTYVLGGSLKLWSMRDAPNSTLPNAVEFFNHAADYTRSYPGGHMINAIVWWSLIVLLGCRLGLRLPVRLVRLAPPIIVFCSTIYLGYHWLTDNLAAIALGLFISRVISRVIDRLFR